MTLIVHLVLAFVLCWVSVRHAQSLQNTKRKSKALGWDQCYFMLYFCSRGISALIFMHLLSKCLWCDAASRCHSSVRSVFRVRLVHCGCRPIETIVSCCSWRVYWTVHLPSRIFKTFHIRVQQQCNALVHIRLSFQINWKSCLGEWMYGHWTQWMPKSAGCFILGSSPIFIYK